MSNQAHREFMTLPGRYYTDSNVFREEMETFYWDDWVCAGRAESISNPGDYFLRDIAGESIIVTRDPTGDARAFYNVCRHRGTRMSTVEEGNFGGRIQCPYHGWTYGLDGRLIGAPHMSDVGFRREDYSLHEAVADVWAGHVFLHLGTSPEPLMQRLGQLPAKFEPWRMHELRMHKRITYEVKANWKLLVLNYNECLHCPMMHPALNRLTDYLAADNQPPTRSYIGGSMGFRDGAETMSIDGRRRRDYLPGLSEPEQRMVAYYAIYPNLLLSLHPDYMMTHTLWPKTVSHTRVVCEWHFHPAEMAKPDFVAEDAVEFWDTTNREDWAISELSQAGIQSRAYRPGPYSSREVLLHAFDEYVLERLRSKERQRSSI
jgi:glycine betaine catabolism A